MLPIVFQALPKWDGTYNSTALTISKLLSEDRTVFYIEHPFSYADVLKKRNFKQLKKRIGRSWERPFQNHQNFITVHPPLTFPFNSLDEGATYNLFKRTYIKKLWKHIDRVLKSFDITEFGYINSFDPVYFNFKSELECKYKVYHSVDLISGEPYIARHGVNAEFLAAKSAHKVVTTSEPIKKRLYPFNPNTRCIPNAVDFNHFSTLKPIPEEFRLSKRKRLVYTGNLGLRLDYSLIERIANAFPEIDIYMIGPEAPAYFKGQKLKLMPNVYFPGPKPFSELPAYIQHADACIIPFKCTDLTYHIYPLKLNEYLSAGKPVVSSNFTDFGEFKNHLFTYDANDEAINQVKLALYESNKKSSLDRVKLASQNTWAHRMRDWKELLLQLEEQFSSTQKYIHPAV